MAWDPIFQTADPQSGNMLVTIHLVQGSQRETRQELMPVATDDTVEAFARKCVDEKNHQAQSQAELTYKKGDLIDTTPPPDPVDPDPELTAYRQSKAAVEDFQAASSLGGLPPQSNNAHAQQKQDMQDKWKDRFAGKV